MQSAKMSFDKSLFLSCNAGSLILCGLQKSFGQCSSLRSELSLTLPSTVRSHVMPRTPAAKAMPPQKLRQQSCHGFCKVIAFAMAGLLCQVRHTFFLRSRLLHNAGILILCGLQKSFGQCSSLRSELSLTLPSAVRPHVAPRTPAQKQCPRKNHASKLSWFLQGHSFC